MKEEMQSQEAIVIMVNDRYYYKHSKKRISTAWCLVGAKLFFAHGKLSAIIEIEDILKNKGYNPKRMSVNLGSEL